MPGKKRKNSLGWGSSIRSRGSEMGVLKRYLVEILVKLIKNMVLFNREQLKKNFRYCQAANYCKSQSELIEIHKGWPVLLMKVKFTCNALYQVMPPRSRCNVEELSNSCA
jgi:hypothetical protein